MTTTFPKTNEVARTWHLIDAKGQVLGRLASEVARRLSGKDKRTYSSHVDVGDYVVIINAKDIRITGNSKPDQKIDFRHSHYPGGDTQTPYREFLKSNPDRAVELAISGMLPKNKLRSRRLRRLKVYKSGDHPHGVNFPSTKSAPAA
jgi:large subunit ribosomal protein L13